MTKHVFSIALSAVLGYAWSVSAQTLPGLTGQGKTLSATLTMGRTTNQSARALLRKGVESVDWDERTFEEVIEWLGGLSDDKVNVIPRWNALMVQGVDRDSLVTLRLRDTSIAEVLDETVDQLSEDGQITYHAVKNKLTISTKADFDRKMYTRVYEVTDLLFYVPDFGRSAPQVDLEAAARRGGGGGGGGQSIFGGSSGSSSSEDLEQEEQELEERIENLRELIMNTIAYESWEETAGGRGRIRIFDNRILVIHNTLEVHEELNGAFNLED